MMLDFVAGGLGLTASYFIGNKKRGGFLIRFAEDSIWIYIGFVTRLYGLVTVAVLAMLVNARNYWKWRHGDKR